LLAIVDIWVDVLAVIIISIGIAFCIFQIIGSFVSGRLQDKFRGKQWPKLEEFIPALPKLLHGALAICVISLGISGLYLRFPFYENGYVAMRQIHHLFMLPLVLIFVLRIYYAILIDADEFSIRHKEIRDSIKIVLYHAFIMSKYPRYARYNILQKMMYAVFFPVLTIVLILSGFSLLWPDALLGWLVDLFGGLAMTITLAVLIHWIAAVSMATLTIIHVCLSFIEDLPTFMIFIGLSEQPWNYEYENTNEQTN
jgi:thiosulfate reductase cytochrome b subunit